MSTEKTMEELAALPNVRGLELVREALSHLQSCAFIATDDRINTEHVNIAAELLRAVVRAAR